MIQWGAVRVLAIVLAAGEGRRMGGPKALLRLGETTFLAHACRLLARPGVASVVAVLGAEAERVRAEVERTPLTGDAMQPVGPVTVSVGLASCPEGWSADFETLLKLADKALYQSKWGGRNRVTVYSSALEVIPVAA